MSVSKSIQVFEHRSLRLGAAGGGISPKLLEGLQKHYGKNGVPYFGLCHNGVRFGSHVGVIQVGKDCIEVLPKVDNRDDETGKKNARDILIEMLYRAGLIRTHQTSFASLSLKRNFILEAYIDMFLTEAEYLSHRGLIKTYRTTEGNRNTMKGRLDFNKNLRHNIVHAERFYVHHTVYDRSHILNRLLLKTLKLIPQLSLEQESVSRVSRLLMDFPEIPDVHVDEPLFDRLTYNRKTEPYRKAIDIARLLLLNYHPDVKGGGENVLALMFDMNMLWEKYVYVMLRKAANSRTEFYLSPQRKKIFWEPDKGKGFGRKRLKPDVVVTLPGGGVFVIDTKWKMVDGKGASEEDLRQMMAYNIFFGGEGHRQSLLVYPSPKDAASIGGKFTEEIAGSTGLCWLPLVNSDGSLNKGIGQQLLSKIERLNSSSKIGHPLK